MNRIAFSEDDAAFTDEVRLLGVGVAESMPAGYVARRRGLDAFLLVLFHDTVTAELCGRRAELPAGSVVLWDRHRPHFFGRRGAEWIHSWVVFRGSVWSCDYDLLRPLCESPQTVRDPSVLVEAYRRVLREFVAENRPHLPLIVTNIQLILQEMGREQLRGRDTASRIDPLQRATRWVRAHLPERMTVADVCRHAGLSPSRLQELFRSREGCSIQVWVERQRLQEARYWLLHSGLSIAEIATRTGFAEGSYLSRRFTQAYGQRPSAYRRFQRESSDPVDSLPRRN